MDVDDYDQYELFQEIQGLQPYWDKCQWLKDPLFRRLTSDIVALPNTEDWVTTWFSSEELLEESLPLDVSFHDPVGHSQFFKRSLILPQGSWIPSECLPTPEERAAAEEELSHHSPISSSRAVMLLTGHFIPYDQNEYSQMGTCEK